MNNYLFYLNIEIIINRNLYKKNIIDEKTYFYVNEKLLQKLKEAK